MIKKDGHSIGCHMNELINLLWGMWDMAVYLCAKPAPLCKLQRFTIMACCVWSRLQLDTNTAKGQHGTVGSGHT